MKKIISGKVRDVYQISDKELVIVATDRISAFDVILKSTIRDKGVALNLISAYWFEYTSGIVPNHLISTKLSDMPPLFSDNPQQYGGRTSLVKKLEILPYEFIVRGYMFGSMWEAYSRDKIFCGQRIQGEYQLAERLAQPILTPAAKNNTGHDEYIPLKRLKQELGADRTEQICDICLTLYKSCYEQALKKGIIIADTKFEFGYDEDGVLTLADEIFTPDSSRFWALADYRTGISPKSYDKQFVRDWLTAHKLNGVTPGPELPGEVVEATAAIYEECRRRIVGEENA